MFWNELLVLFWSGVAACGTGDTVRGLALGLDMVLVLLLRDEYTA